MFKATSQASVPVVSQSTDMIRSAVMLARAKCGQTHQSPNSSPPSQSSIIAIQSACFMVVIGGRPRQCTSGRPTLLLLAEEPGLLARLAGEDEHEPGRDREQTAHHAEPEQVEVQLAHTELRMQPRVVE